MNNDIEKIYSREILFQDLGMLLYLVALFGGTLILGFSEETLRLQNAVMLLLAFLVALLVAFRMRVAAIICAALQILLFCAYKLYQYAAFHISIEYTAYAWPFLILAVLGGMHMFISMYASMETVNGMLNRRIDELTLLDSLTGLENLRSLYASLKRYMAHSQRHGTAMGLMLVQLRYPNEVRKVLSAQEFNILRSNMAQAVENVMRVEDRVFTMDDRGSIGIIYFSDPEGAPIIKRRVLAAVEGAPLLNETRRKTFTVEIKVVYKQYSPEYEQDALRFVADVTGEFAYEV